MVYDGYLALDQVRLQIRIIKMSGGARCASAASVGLYVCG